MTNLINMPRFPLTEFYEPYGPEFVDHGYYDQAFLFCERCVHGKLEAIVPPAVLYGASYRTRSAASVGSMAALVNFSAFILQTDLDVETVIDIGGNDASLVRRLPGAVKVVVDPNAAGDGVVAVREFIEDADLSDWKGDRKLVVSSHTLEHIADPTAFFQKVASVCMHGDWLAIQVPSLEAMVRDARIDHIHHQHVNYFSRHSLGRMLAAHGFEIVRHDYDMTHWGALMVMCRRGHAEPCKTGIVPSTVQNALARFRARLSSVEIPGNVAIGFGAALMLPVLVYWMPHLQNIEYIADNDPAKNGLRYINFDKEIRSDYNLERRTVVITAVGTRLAYRELIKQAIDKGAQDVIVPLGVL
jgi:hypothetical protein